jgi:hypothetical protein
VVTSDMLKDLPKKLKGMDRGKGYLTLVILKH